MFQDHIAASEKAAASIYHEVISLGVDVLRWETNEMIKALTVIGADRANNLLMRCGVPQGTVHVVEEDVMLALKHMAALDPTVDSNSGLSQIVGGAAHVAVLSSDERPQDIESLEAAAAGAKPNGLVTMPATWVLKLLTYVRRLESGATSPAAPLPVPVPLSEPAPA